MFMLIVVICEDVLGLNVMTMAKSPFGAKSSAFDRLRNVDEDLLVCACFANFTAIGMAIETTNGAIPGAKPTPKAATLTTSRRGEFY